jgi:hypothetical protein
MLLELRIYTASPIRLGMSDIVVDPEVIAFINKEGKDFRVCTDCSGPVLLPTTMKPAKDTDIKIKAGRNMLFISRIQARYITRVTLDMLWDPSRRASCGMYDDY